MWAIKPQKDSDLKLYILLSEANVRGPQFCMILAVWSCGKGKNITTISRLEIGMQFNS